jgi:hypothetical protein
MATKPKTHMGTMACLCCGHEIPVKAAENGTLNAACAWCDFPAYAKAGTEAHRIITGKLKNKPAPAATPAPAPAPAAKPAAKPAPAPEPAPAAKPRPRNSIFDLGT